MKAGVSLLFGVKELPVHIVWDDYYSQLRWIDKKFVVLWDVEEKRGWLVSGSKALLRIVRASLKREEDVFKSSDLEEPPRPYPEGHAIMVLLK